jgi:hypothetical protein
MKGYYASEDVCVVLPENCLNASKQGACLLCVPNYFLQLDRCFAVNQSIPNCLLYSQYSYIPRCVECGVGYFVVLGGCVEIPPYCSMLLSDGQCAICLTGFSLRGGKCQLDKKGDNSCLKEAEGKCLQCRNGSVLAINGACYAYKEQGCLQYDEAGVCMGCGLGSVVSGKECLLGKVVDQNCKRYEGEYCRECYSGYYLGANQCWLPNSDCKSSDPSNGSCLSCYPGYTLTNWQCVVLARKPHCLAYDAKASCIRCERFFFVGEDICVKVSALCSQYN